MARGLVARLRSLWRGVQRRGDVEQEMSDEFRHHIEMRAADLVRAGLSPADALRRAQLEFGSVERYKDEGRASRGLRRVDDLRVSWLDLKLGARMLVKYPALSIVGGLGMAVAMAVGAGVFSIIETITNPTLPLDEGDRVVILQNFNAAAHNTDHRVLHDFVDWRTSLHSVRDLAAYRETARNLIIGGDAAERVNIAEMTASGFRVARVAPLLGRYLTDDDERIGAPNVVVIGYEVWQARFGSDMAIVGRTLQLGAEPTTIIGVMPKGFAFPMSYALWAPLRLDASAYPRGRSPNVTVFGRLAPNVTLAQAQAELATVGRRTAAAYPAIYEHLTPLVSPYTHPFFEMDEPGNLVAAHVVQIAASLLLVVICVNVAVLVYARTATRHGEIAVRTALGASRGRIVAQLFGEALVLSTGSAVISVLLTHALLRQVNDLFDLSTGGGRPFWFDVHITPGTVAYAVGLTILGAVIVGVVPALHATGRQLTAALRQLGTGGAPRLGGTWTVLIVAQVAITVAVLPAALQYSWKSVRLAIAGPGFAAGELLTAGLSMDVETPPRATDAAAAQARYARRFADRQTELVRRIAAEPGVAAVTFAEAIPGGEGTVWVDVEGIALPADTSTDTESIAAGSRSGHQVQLGQVGVGFFEAFGAPLVAGRAFRTSDTDATSASVIVNRTFVTRVLGGTNALGRRVRFVGRGRDASAGAVVLGQWYEIVGVVGDLPLHAIQSGGAEARIYEAVAPGALRSLSLFVRMRGAAPSTFVGRLRQITTALDPTLSLRGALPLDEVYRQHQLPLRLAAIALAAVTLSVMLLSAAGIYALMSVIVTRRRREIGIRIALGADRRRILASIFSRAVGQLAIGVVIGIATAVGLDRLSRGGVIGEAGAIILPLVAVVMLAVGVLAAVGPARRGLGIEPTEALRSDA